MLEPSLIKQYVWEPVNSNSYLITENNKGLLIDAVDSQELYEAIKPLKKLTIILTHCHFDHISGLNTIRELKPDCEVITTSLCSDFIGNAHRNMSAVANVFMMFYNKTEEEKDLVNPYVCEPANKVFEEKMNFNWNDHEINLLAVHGHSSDGLIAILDDKYMFSGDSLLSIPTVTRFPNGNSKKFSLEDIPLFKSLNQKLVVYPGHGETGSIKDMLEVNIKHKKRITNNN